MSRAWRFRLTVAMVLLGIPALLACVVVWFLTTGRLEQRISEEYSRLFPGILRIGKLQLTGADEARCEAVSISEGEHTLVTVPLVVIKLDVFSLRLLGIKAEGAHIRLDPEGFDLLDRITEAGGALPPSANPPRWTLDVTDSTVWFPRGATISAARASGTVVGPSFRLDCSGLIHDRLGQQPVTVDVHGLVTSLDRRRIDISLSSASVDARDAMDSLESCSMLPESGPVLKGWLPAGRLNCAGTVISIAQVDRHRGPGGPAVYHVDMRATWRDGSISGPLILDRDRISMPRFTLVDRYFANATDASLDYDQRSHRLTASAANWAPGQRLPVPVGLATAELLATTPAIALDVRLKEPGIPVELRLTARAPERDASQITIAWSDLTPLRIEAQGLPLSLGRTWLPKGLSMHGNADELRLSIDIHSIPVRLRDLWLRMRQTRLTWEGWTFGPADGELALRPYGRIPEDPIAATFSLSRPGIGGAAGALATITWNGTPMSTRITADTQQIESILTRLRGTVVIPDIRGAVSIIADVDQPAAGGIEANVQRLGLNQLSINDGLGRSAIDGVQSELKGRVTASASIIAIRAGGQLARGRLRLPGTWLDLASQTPLFTLSAHINPSTTGSSLRLDELLVRAAHSGGDPLPDGYSAQVSGQLGGDGNGRFKGLVDRANLGWINQLAPLRGGNITGEAAVVCEAAVTDGQIRRVSGTALPLSAAVQLAGGLAAEGITGALRFELEPPVDQP